MLVRSAEPSIKDLPLKQENLPEFLAPVWKLALVCNPSAEGSQAIELTGSLKLSGYSG